MSSKLWSKWESYPLVSSVDTTAPVTGKSDQLGDDWSDQELDDLFQSPLEEVLDSMRFRSSQHISRHQCFRSVLYLSLISLVFGFTFGIIFVTTYQDFHSRVPPIHRQSPQTPSVGPHLKKQLMSSYYELNVRNTLFKHISSEDIAYNLGKLSGQPIIGEQHAIDNNTLFVYNIWLNQGLNVTLANYTVLMSYQMPSKPNLVFKYDKTNHLIYTSSPYEDPLNATADERSYYTSNPPFLAFSNSTGSQRLKGHIVYVNYGRDEDYDYLKQHNVSVSGHIVVVRYAKIFRANIVKLAEDNGAIGAIIYTDPYDYTDGDQSNTYPKSVYLPKSGVQRGTVRMGDGDPQTPLYPSIKSAYRLPMNELQMPRIPAHAISYLDAKYILHELNGMKAPDGWVGGLNITYNLGPGYKDKGYVELEVNTYLKETPIYNVIGVITGCTEPDRYVLVGNHRDSWTFGALDPLSGTAAMLELSSAFMNTIRSEKWCPRRSIIFCSWAAEEWGLIGSTEWVEENVKLLETEAVAYINVDIAVKGNYTFQAAAVPLLYSTVWDATKVVANPNEKEVTKDYKTVFDSYLEHRPSKSFNWTHLPDIKNPGSGSDHMPFLQISGVPVIDMYYDCDDSSHIKCYPLYHTMYDTFNLISNLTDKGFKYSKALTQIWAEMLRSLSDSPLLPFRDSLQYYPHFLYLALDDLKNSKYSYIFAKYNITLDFMYEAIDDFDSAVNWFSKQIKRIDEQNPLELRRVNDIMMRLERAFLDDQGLPFRKQYKHTVLSASALDSYSGSSFAALYDLLWQFTHEPNDKLLALIKQHLSVIVFHINSAKLMLKQTSV